MTHRPVRRVSSSREIQYMTQPKRLTLFADLTFDDFRRLAQDPALSRYEKIGFPDEYRMGCEEAIFEDICDKMAPLSGKAKRVVDIGPGCSELPLMLAKLCAQRAHHLTWVDSAEMLEHLPAAPFIRKVCAQFPQGCEALVKEYRETCDAVLTYSVLHYVLPGNDIFAFVDAAASLLAPGGVLLIGDIPNVSARKRFFASDRGRRHHQTFTASTEVPTVEFNVPEPGRIDDSVILGLLMRLRAAGFQAYVVPQGEQLPMANRREDIIVIRP
jgi:2-polyprenyl-3-methyl-5-hydroxy-6-metoxy-1,4-benzoquinol methylase